jgi:hypothetical protein
MPPGQMMLSSHSTAGSNVNNSLGGNELKNLTHFSQNHVNDENYYKCQTTKWNDILQKCNRSFDATLKNGPWQTIDILQQERFHVHATNQERNILMLYV